MNKYEKQIKEILENETYLKNTKIDKLFELDCEMYTNLGTDSSDSERNEAKRVSNLIYIEVSKLDQELNYILKSKD